MGPPSKLRIGYVPEHFSSPLTFAQQHYGLDADLIPFPTGTGALAGALKSDSAAEGSIDVAIGLTEGFVADLGKTRAAGQSNTYRLFGTYVRSPLRWAISTGTRRDDVTVDDLREKRVGVSRIGSGSYVMSYVLADQRGWLDSTGSSGGDKKEPFRVAPIGDFAALRRAVNDDDTADFFMWEHFTSKHFWDTREIRRIGEIYTPWPSWMIAARDGADDDGALRAMAESLDRGVAHYRDNPDEAVRLITSTMRYSEEDAREWMKTVRFADAVRGVSPRVIGETIGVLRKAGVLGERAGSGEEMISCIADDN